MDPLTGFLTVRLGKNGHVRRVPLNSAARGTLLDLAGQRTRPTDAEGLVSKAAYREFVRAVGAAQATLRAAGRRTRH